ncbi:hypothetical protein Ancab_019749 [Ancistrocladus abbreviatus]
MENSKQHEEAAQDRPTTDLLKLLIHHLGSHMRSTHLKFGDVCVDGTSVGSRMTVGQGVGNTREELDLDRHSINIYINNNIQGVTNSILVGSEVKMVESGVGLSFGDVMLDRGSEREGRKRASKAVSWDRRVFSWMLLFACLLPSLLVSLILCIIKY